MSTPNPNATGGDNSQGEGAGTAAGQDQGAGQPSGQQPPNSSGTATDPNQAAGAGTAGKVTFSPEQQAYINGLVKSEKDKEVAKAKTKWEADQKLSEDERTKKELDETRSQLAERDRRDYVVDAAAKAGVKNAKLFYNAYKGEFETDDKGRVTNLKDVLESAKAESPELFGGATPPPTPAGSADGGAGAGAGVADLYTKEQLSNLSLEEVEKNSDKVNRSLAALK